MNRQLSRRSVLQALGVGTLSLLAAGCRRTPPLSGSRPPTRPNILYLHSHDLGRYIQPYGFNVETPNLQRFADEGVVFEQAFSASPTCSPSRAALLTGMTPGCNGMWGLTNRGWGLDDTSTTLQHLLKQNGYRTALVGVQHIASGRTPEEAAANIGYDHVPQVRGKLAHAVAETAVEYLENAPREPFFLDVGFVETHVLKGGPASSHWGYPDGDAGKAAVLPPLDDVNPTRQDMADFSVSLGALDQGMGRVLDTLERVGIKNDTLVLITTDHGIPLPGFKANYTDGGLGVTLMMRWPRRQAFAGGKRVGALVSQLDFFPTLCDVMEVSRPGWLQGESLLPLLNGDVEQINDAIFAENESHAVPEPQACVRTRRFKYIRRLDGNDDVRPANTDDTFTKELWLSRGWGKTTTDVERLYDLEADPLEQVNLAYVPEYGDTLREMRERMVARMDRHNNPLLQKYRVADAPPERLSKLSIQTKFAPKDLAAPFQSDIGVLNSAQE